MMVLRVMQWSPGLEVTDSIYLASPITATRRGCYRCVAAFLICNEDSLSYSVRVPGMCKAVLRWQCCIGRVWVSVVQG